MSYVFDDFFTSGREESISPFLKKGGGRLSKNLPIKSAIISAAFLVLAYAMHFISMPLANLLLIIVYFLSGSPSLLNTIEDLKKLVINIDILMTLAAFLAVLIGAQLEGALLLVLFDHGLDLG